ncbi:hypothetical protein DPMN_133859 [Dreissena polymorpha]|uniref:Uncharacterized protein n=1 Tax=Dreissena polymorpha TaxID=45954 RepID=A0A9D4FV35_DREPO|nr:hypothetical protein DPMN_133859 [Dreissena polymorpha]
MGCRRSTSHLDMMNHPQQRLRMVSCSMRMILLSTLHCMKTKQLSVVSHRQQQNQTKLTLETVKLRSLCLSGLSVTY